MARRVKRIEKPKEPAINPEAQLLQQITNLCTMIGDASFEVRQKESQIVQLFAQLDKTREDLYKVRVAANGSKDAK